VPISEIEQATGLTDRRLRQLADDGFFPMPQAGLYKFAETMVGLNRFYRERAAQKTAAQERVHEARAKLLEHKYEVERGNHIHRDECRRVFSRFISAAKTRLLNIPRRLGQVIAITSDPVECEKRIMDEIVDALSELNKCEYNEK